MKISGRAFLKVTASLVAVLVLLAVLVHTRPVEDAVRGWVVRTIADRLGGHASVEGLDYTLWRGELRGYGVSWTSDDQRISLAIDEVVVVLVPRGATLVELRAPNVRFQSRDDDADAAAEIRLPPAVLALGVTVSDGRLAADGVEVEDIEARLVPALGSWDGEVSTGNVRVTALEDLPSIDSARARFRVGSTSATISESRVELDASYATLEGRIASFSPLVAEADVSHSIEGDLLEEILLHAAEVTDLVIDDAVTGEAAIRFENDALGGEGVLESSGVAYTTVQLANVRVPWTLENDVVRVDEASFATHEGQARVSARVDLAASTQELDVSFEGLEPDPRIATRVDGTATVSLSQWDVDSSRGQANLELRPLRGLDGMPLGGRVQLDLAGGELSVRAPHLEGPGFDADVSGKIGERVALQYSARVADLTALSFLPPDVPLAGALQIEGRVEGPVGTPRATAEISTSDFAISDVALDTGASLSWQGDRVELGSLSLRHASGGALTLSGTYDLAREVLSLHGEGEDFVLREIPELEATVSAIQVAIEGPVRALSGSASAELDDVRFRGVSLPRTSIAVEADGEEARLTAVAEGERLASARVNVASPYAAEGELRLDRLPIAELLQTFPAYADTELDVQGRLVATGELSDAGSVRYRIEAEQVVGSYRGVGFGVSAPFVVEGDLESLTVHDLTLVGEDTAIGLEGTLPLTSSGTIDLTARGVARLELLSLWFPDAALGGRADLEIRAGGELHEPELHGDIVISDAGGVFEGIPVEGVRGRASLTGMHLEVGELTGELLGGRFLVEGDVPLARAGDAEARLRFRFEDVVPTMLLDDDQELELRVSASGELTGGRVTDVVGWRGGGTIDEVTASVGAVALASAEPATWTLDGGHVRLSELRVSGVDTDLVIAGEANPLADPVEWNVRASGQIDPRFLAPALAELGMAFTGETEFHLTARQGVEPLVLEGNASIRNGRLAVREPALAFTNLTGDLEIRNQTMRLTRLEANVGGGSVRADGEIGLDGASVTDVDLRARAQAVRLEYPEGLRSEIEGQLRLSGSPSALALTGDVTLARAIFSRNVNLQSELLESLSRVATLAPADTIANRIRLDLRVRTREGLRVDNNLASMDASASMTLGGTVAAPELAGTLTARQGGEFRFGRNTYRIESGRIELQRYPIEPPVLDINARTTVSEYDIQLAVSGTADDLTTVVSGTSQRDGRAISRADAAALLVTGRTVDRVSTEGRTILGEQMASYLGASLADLAQFGLGGALPFDIVTVQPSLIAGEADPSARFTLGAGLTEDLSVVYSIGLNDAESQIWIVDYELPRRTRTQLIRQEDNEFTFAFGQELQFARGAAAGGATEARVDVSSVGFYFVSGEPGDLDVQARERLGIDVGERYEYWRAWERAERLQRWLRDLGFLEATVDLNASPCGEGCVDLDVVVQTGKRVRFVWSGDDLEESVKNALTSAWDGYMTPAFLTSDLASIAEGMLFERRYYLARVQVSVEDRPDETEVTVHTTVGPRGTRVAVDFIGNESIPDETLLEALPRRSTTEFHQLITVRRPRLRQILDIRYASLGHLQAEISDPETSFDAATGVLHVAIPIEEGEPSIVDRVELAGVESVDETTIRSRLSLREGDPFGLTQFVQDRSTIAAFYRRQGFADVEVDSAILPGDAPGLLVARYEVREGPEVTVGEIEVAGNDHTRESIIRREVALKPGQPLRLSDVSTTQKQLYELGIFRSADVVVTAPEDEIDGMERSIVVEVTEAPELSLDYGVRYTTDGLFQVVADVGVPNLLGRAQGVGVRTLFGTDEQIFRFTYRTPYVARFKLRTDFFVERRLAEEAPDELGGIAFEERDWTFTAQQTRPFEDQLSLQWSYSFKQTASAFDDPIFGPVELSQNQSVLTSSLIGDYRNSVVDPTHGSLWSVTVQGAPQFFASDFKFVKVFGQLYTYVGLGDGVVWAGGYRAGAIENLGQTLLEDDRFQAGGPNSVRGFEQDALGPPLGGEGVLIVNQEIRYPLFWRLRGVGFYDAGNAFATPSEIRLSDLRHSAGLGVRFALPFGLIRLDFARILDLEDGEDPWRFIFSLGHAF